MKVTGLSRPHPHETENGDRWLTIPHRHGHRVIVIDGAGHGPEAARVAELVVETIRSCDERDIAELLRLCHERLRGTRGAVMSVADLIDDTLTFAGVGNVDGVLVDAHGTRRFLPDRGMLGAALPGARPVSIQLTDPWAFVLHSDGVSDKFGASVAIYRIADDPDRFLRETVEAWARSSDDATLVVVQRE